MPDGHRRLRRLCSVVCIKILVQNLLLRRDLVGKDRFLVNASLAFLLKLSNVMITGTCRLARNPALDRKHHGILLFRSDDSLASLDAVSRFGSLFEYGSLFLVFDGLVEALGHMSSRFLRRMAFIGYLIAFFLLKTDFVSHRTVLDRLYYFLNLIVATLLD